MLEQSSPSAKRARTESCSRFSTDADLFVKVDDETFSTHSVVLMLASPVFKAMLSNYWAESSKSTLTLPGKDKDQFRVFLEALQPDTTVELTKDNVEYLVKLADEYQVNGLKGKCEAFIMSNVPITLMSLDFAINYKLEHRKGQCTEKIKANIDAHIEELKLHGPTLTHEVLELLWPSVCAKVGVDMPQLPPEEHVHSMWPFVVIAMECFPFKQRCRDMKFWPNQLYNLLPTSKQADDIGRQWLTAKINSLGME